MSSSAYRIVLTDADRFRLGESHHAELEKARIELIGTPYGISEDALAEQCSEADGLMVFGTKITRKVIERMVRCKIIARCGIGYDNIDVFAAFEKGIKVTYVPDYCLEEVSDHTIALMLDCLRKVSFSRERVKGGYWDPYERLGVMRRVSGQTVGLLGFGRIGQTVARKLMGFDVHLLVHDPYIPEHTVHSFGGNPATFDELISKSDIICILLPLSPETKHIIERSVFERMKKGVILINTSRGALIDEEALVVALHEGIVSAAGLDVLEMEPPSNHPLVALPQVVITPHSAAFSEEALHDVKTKALTEILRNFQGLEPLQPVPSQTIMKGGT